MVKLIVFVETGFIRSLLTKGSLFEIKKKISGMSMKPCPTIKEIKVKVFWEYSGKYKPTLTIIPPDKKAEKTEINTIAKAAWGLKL